MAVDLSQYLDVPDALLQEQMPGVDIAALKEKIRQSQQPKEANATPVTQTIKTDPVTGEQTMTVSGSVQDLSPANPLAPTISPGLQNRPAPVAAPVAPVNPAEAYNKYTALAESGMKPDVGYHNINKSTAYGTYGLTQPQYQEIQKANPAFANRPIESLTPQEQGQANLTSRDVYARQLQAKGVEPTEENIRLAHFLGAGGANQFLKSGAISPEAAAANGGEARVRQIAEARMRGPGQQGPVAPGSAPAMIAGQPTSDVGLTPTEQAIKLQQQEVPAWQQTVLNAQGDPKKLAQIMAGDYPDDAKTLAQNMIVQNSLTQKQELDAQKKLQGFAQGDPTATRDVMKLIKQQSEEGSYVKAVLFSQLGLGDLAKQEQAKLGGPAISKAMVNGQSYLTESRNGVVVGAYDPTGKRVDDVTLAKINAEATPQGTHAYGFTGEAAIVPGTNEEVRQRTNAITGKVEYVHVTGPKAGQVYSGAAVPTPKSVSTAAAKMDYGVISKYREKYGTDILGALDQMRKDRGSLTPQEEQDFLNQYRFNQGPPGVGAVPAQPGAVPAQPVPGVAPAQPAPAGVAGPVRPGVPGAAPQAAPAPGAAPARPVAPGQAPAQVAPTAAPISNIPGAGEPPVRGINEPESIYKLRKDAYETQAKDIAQGEAKVKLALPQYESNAEQILGTIERVVGTSDKPAPGFEANVGVRNPLGVLQLRGTDARGWQSQYKQLMGQNFLSAFNDLKGAGAITDAEGKAATEARAALSDPGISEDDFRKNAKILEDTIKKGVNRQRALAGQPPKYDLSTEGTGDVMSKADEILNKGKKKP